MEVLSKDDVFRAIGHLNLSIDDERMVEKAMESLSKRSHIPCRQVKQLLDELDLIEAQMQQESVTPSFALTQVDVLQYAEKQKIAGHLIMIWQKVNKLGKLLGLTPNFERIEGMARAIKLPLPSPPQRFGQLTRN